MEQLKINFFKIRNIVIMHIISQPASIKLGDFRFVSSDGIFFESSSEPQITPDGIYLRGSSVSKNENVVVISFYSNDEATRRMQLFTRGLEELKAYIDSGMKEIKKPRRSAIRSTSTTEYTSRTQSNYEDTSSEPTYWTA